MLPTLFGSSVAQINLLFDTLLASFLTTGSVSWLYYSDRLVEFPLGVFGVALGTVVLPSLSQKHADAATEDFCRTLDWAMRWVLLIGLPATIGLFLLAGPLLTTLFQYGAFTSNDVKMASQSLMAYSLGLTLFMLIKVMAPGFYARQDTRTPVRIGIIAMVANMALNILLIFPLAHAGLALATSISAGINAALLLLVLRRQGIYRAQKGWLQFLLQIISANILLGVFLWFSAGTPESWEQNDALQRSIHLAGLVFGSLIIYCLGLFATGIRLHQLKS
jgi:putative peptidoglycan lipid II flippase